MDYLSVAEARARPGLKLVLSTHVPGPWGEAAKAVLRARRLDFIPVAQTPMAPNEDLVAWTGIRNAPILVPDEGPPLSGWLDILMFAEASGTGPSLLPDRSADRVLVFGLAAEICAPGGLGWSRRLSMFQKAGVSDQPPQRAAIIGEYGYSPSTVSAASRRVIEILETLAAQLHGQRSRGSRYLVGERLSACDLYWTCFSITVRALAPEEAPMPEQTRRRYTDVDPAIAEAVHPILIEHRDFIYREHIGLPLDF